MSQAPPTSPSSASPGPGDRPHLLLVEDEALFARAVSRRLEKAGFAVTAVATLHEATQALANSEPDLMLLDMRLPDGSGLDFLAGRVQEGTRRVPVIAMSAYGELEDAVGAMKLGAADYLKKPIDLEELLLNLRKVLANQAVSRQLEYSRARESVATDDGELLGDSLATRALRTQISRLAALGLPGQAPTVLILGETGVGKDLTARLLHRQSPRAGRPFVHVDCAALPRELIESELFGHVKGAFTNAIAERTGLIEAAEDGVVFLDEIAELPLDLQTRLLAVLERRALRRVGSSQERRTDAWFIAATNRDVERMVADGKLRADLYYRLNVMTLNLPPLRERVGDAVALAEHLGAQFARRYGIPSFALTPAARVAIDTYPWPGNVRELRHVVERAVLLAGGGAVTPEHLPFQAQAHAHAASGSAPPASPDTALYTLTLEAAERLLIEHALQRTGNNISEAARQLGITRMTMRYRMKQHGL